MASGLFLGNGPRPTTTTGRNRNTLINLDSKQDVGNVLKPGRRATYSQPEAAKPKSGGYQKQRQMSKLMDAQKPQAAPSKPADFSKGTSALESQTGTIMGILQTAQLAKAMQKTGGGKGGQPDFSDLAFRGGAPQQNIMLGKKMAKEMGWTDAHWRALKALWMRESGWRTNADNPTSSAYGIPQRLGSVHGMPRKYMRNPKAQIAWGLQYIAGKYGDPLTALRHSNREGWY